MPSSAPRNTFVSGRIGANAAGMIRRRHGATGNSRIGAIVLPGNSRILVGGNLNVLKRRPHPLPISRRPAANVARHAAMRANPILAS